MGDFQISRYQMRLEITECTCTMCKRRWQEEIIWKSGPDGGYSYCKDNKPYLDGQYTLVTVFYEAITKLTCSRCAQQAIENNQPLIFGEKNIHQINGRAASLRRLAAPRADFKPQKSTLTLDDL